MCEIDIGDLGLDAPHADRAEDVVEEDARAVQFGFVIAHPDRMIVAAIDERHLDPFGADAEFVELARSSDRTPQPGKAGP